MTAREVTEDVLSVELRHRLRRFELDVRFGLGRETLALVGPSGAGKTSVLRAVAGLLRPDGGKIVLGDLVLVDTRGHVGLPPEDRAVGMVFQDGALFPHLTVAQNVAYGLRPRPRGRRERSRRVTELLERFGIASLARARPVESPAANASGPLWPAPSAGRRRCCCWTSRSPPSTR